jgi:hypothetical protein
VLLRPRRGTGMHRHIRAVDHDTRVTGGAELPGRIGQPVRKIDAGGRCAAA